MFAFCYACATHTFHSFEVSFLHTWESFCLVICFSFLCFRLLWLCALQNTTQSYSSIDMSGSMMKWTWQSIEPKPFTLGSMIYKLHTFFILCFNMHATKRMEPTSATLVTKEIWQKLDEFMLSTDALIRLKEAFNWVILWQLGKFSFH